MCNCEIVLSMPDEDVKAFLDCEAEPSMPDEAFHTSVNCEAELLPSDIVPQTSLSSSKNDPRSRQVLRMDPSMKFWSRYLPSPPCIMIRCLRGSTFASMGGYLSTKANDSGIKLFAMSPFLNLNRNRYHRNKQQ